jgi:hypothetical protein
MAAALGFSELEPVPLGDLAPALTGQALLHDFFDRNARFFGDGLGLAGFRGRVRRRLRRLDWRE